MILIGRKQNSVDGANLFYKEPVIALNIREWIQHLSALKTWIGALEGKHAHTQARPAFIVP